MTEDVLDAEVIDPKQTQALVPKNYGTGALQAPNPQASLERASQIASALKPVIERQGLSKSIQGKNYVFVEGWTTLAALCGMTPMEISNEDVGGGVYVSTVELVNAEGRSIGRASAECGNADELDRNGNPIWANRPAYARRSMANTRATSKVCRQVLSWVMTLAGYAPTPAEEMDFADNGSTSASTSRSSSSKPRTQSTAKSGGGGGRGGGYGKWTGEVVLKSGKNAGKRWMDIDHDTIAFLAGKDNKFAKMEQARRLALENEMAQDAGPEPESDEPPPVDEELF